MVEVILWLLLVWLLGVLGVRTMGPTTVRRTVALALLPVGVAAMLWFGDRMNVGTRLMAGTFGLLFLFKFAVLFWSARAEVRDLQMTGGLLYLTVWPGMDPTVFGRSERAAPAAGRMFVKGYLWFLCGLTAGATVAVFAPVLPFGVRSWLGVFVLLTVLHFGLADVFSALMKAAGWPVRRMFRDPLMSTSVRSFWSRRWNMPFVELSRGFFYPALRGIGGRVFAAVGVFLFSGLLHELAISYPAGGGWGKPTAYFLLQGVVYFVEEHVFDVEARWPAAASRAWAYFWVLAPLPILFHVPFRDVFVDALFLELHEMLVEIDPRVLFSTGLWMGAAGHVFVLAASVQVPFRFNWTEELAGLRPMNRKLFWTYGGYIVGMILSFAAATVLFHEQMLDGRPAALGFAGVITMFWLARVGVDLFYMEHVDWPDGPWFDAGHALLVSLFLFFITVYGGIVVRQWM